jgi:hypothetical protein
MMINNGGIDMTAPLIVIGAPIEPDTGALDPDLLPQQLEAHLVFAASLMTHLAGLQFIPAFCLDDATTVVLDPARLATDRSRPPLQPVDLLGRPVTGAVRWNPGTLCLMAPFYEVAVPNGIPDIWEHTALDNIMHYAEFGPVDAEPLVESFFAEIIAGLAGDYNVAWDRFSMFAFEKPVPFDEPENLLRATIERGVRAGATSVLVYDFYNKANDFEMSAGSWPHFQKTVDSVNTALGADIRLGAIATNQLQLKHYEGFYRSVYLAARELVRAHAPAIDAQIGIIIAAHGSSTTNRLYDVSNIVNNPEMARRLEDYFSARAQALHTAGPQSLVCYSEYANSADDGLRGVGEQVRDWVAAGYDYVFVVPMEWQWQSRDIWAELRTNAIEFMNITEGDAFARDAYGRSLVHAGATTVVFGETILEQASYNPAARHYLRAAATALLEDRLIGLTGAAAPAAVSGSVRIRSEQRDLNRNFSDTLVVHAAKAALQTAGISAAGTTAEGSFTGAADADSVACWIFAELADEGVPVDAVAVSRADAVVALGSPLRGVIEADAVAEIEGRPEDLTVRVEFQEVE